jgi:hypothetical protein
VIRRLHSSKSLSCNSYVAITSASKKIALVTSVALGSHTQRRATRRSAYRTAHETGVDHQPQDSQSARSHHPAVVAAARGSGARVNRRAFVTGLGAVLAAPLGVEAQPAARTPAIGVLAPGSPPPKASPAITAFVQGLRDLGWGPGRNITLEYRWTEDREDGYPEFARDLIRFGVDLIVGAGNAVRAAKQATTTNGHTRA